jgi:hypothetical protein
MCSRGEELPLPINKPFKCPYPGCDTSVRTETGLNIHKSRVHKNEELTLLSENGVFPCPASSIVKWFHLLACLESEEPQPLFPSVFELYSDAITCGTAESESVCDRRSRFTSPAWNYASPELSSIFQPPEEAGRCLTESDIMTGLSEDEVLPSPSFPPVPGSKQHPKRGNGNWKLGSKNPHLVYESHPLINGECFSD